MARSSEPQFSSATRSGAKPLPGWSRTPQVRTNEEKQQTTLVEKIRAEAEHGLPGVGASLILHLAIIGLLAIWFLSPSKKSEVQPLEISWMKSRTLAGSPDGAGGTDRKGKIDLTLDPGKRNIPKNENPTQGPQPKKGADVKPAVVKGLFDGRNRRMRKVIRQKEGGSEKAEQAVTLGLAWLARVQNNDGHWALHEGYPDAGARTVRTDTGATALALMCFLGDGHTHLSGDYKEVVGKALTWMKGIQKDDGNFHEHTELGRKTAFYAHAQATMAMCEAFAMTGDRSLREPIERAVKFLVATQQPVNGGWKYQPQNEESHGDLSVTGWCLMALHSARAAGIEVPDKTWMLSSRFLDLVSAEGESRYKYEPDDPPSRVTAALTAEGLLSRQYLGWSKDHPAMKRGLEFLSADRNQPTWARDKRNVYYWYYATQFFHNLGGEPWRNWYARVQKEIFDNQVKVGGAKVRGSWSPHTGMERKVPKYGDPLEHAREGGRLYITCLCLLTLEAPYRHKPLYETE